MLSVFWKELGISLGCLRRAIEKTAYIYRKAQERGLVRGRTIPSVLSAAAYIACREMGISRTLSDISDLTNIKRKRAGKNYSIAHTRIGFEGPYGRPYKMHCKSGQ